MPAFHVVPVRSLPVSRPVFHQYQDPANLVWLEAAARLGISVRRSDEAYASWDGEGTLTLATDAQLDADDCLAQMLFHEICHLLVAGEEARHRPDWGLDNTSPRDLVHEYATNRLQAALAQGYGLRDFMAVTTVWRRYYDALPADPLAAGDDAAIPLARAGLERARRSPYREVLHEALEATARLADTLRPWIANDSLWSRTRGKHPAGFRLHADAARRCADCAWSLRQRGNTLGCRMTHAGCEPVDYRLVPAERTKSLRLVAAQQACEHFEPVLSEEDCAGCGACCHRGFDVVDVGASERFARRHPELIERRTEERCVVPRPDGRCVALDGDGTAMAPWRCRYYAERPRSCRDFAVGGDACLIARRRCGIRAPDGAGK